MPSLLARRATNALSATSAGAAESLRRTVAKGTAPIDLVSSRPAASRAVTLIRSPDLAAMETEKSPPVAGAAVAVAEVFWLVARTVVAALLTAYGEPVTLAVVASVIVTTTLDADTCGGAATGSITTSP